MLIEAYKLIDQREISQQNQNVQGDTSALLSASLCEYLLSHLSIAGRNEQFHTLLHQLMKGEVRTTDLGGLVNDADNQDEQKS